MSRMLLFLGFIHFEDFNVENEWENASVLRLTLFFSTKQITFLLICPFFFFLGGGVNLQVFSFDGHILDFSCLPSTGLCAKGSYSLHLMARRRALFQWNKKKIWNCYNFTMVWLLLWCHTNMATFNFASNTKEGNNIVRHLQMATQVWRVHSSLVMGRTYDRVDLTFALTFQSARQSDARH